VLLNGSGALALTWMVLDRWSITSIIPIGILSVIVPFILEIVAIFN